LIYNKNANVKQLTHQVKEIELLLHACHFELPFHEQFRQDTSPHFPEQYFAISAYKY
jgi:hypothetical protein